MVTLFDILKAPQKIKIQIFELITRYLDTTLI